jgi:hypothetical protein
MHLPAPLRAAVGLAATATDEARRLPERALELPMLFVSTALQASVRAQQRYARLTARGDAVLNRKHPTDEPPEWATFDEPLSDADLRRAPSRFDAVESLARDSAAQRARLTRELIDAESADEDADETAQSAPNGGQPDVPATEPPVEPPTGRHAATTQPRQPPARTAPAGPPDAPTTGESSDVTPNDEPADP